MNTNLFFPCQLDGVRVRPPVRPHEGIRIYQRTRRIYLETDFGLYLSFDGNQNAGKWYQDNVQEYSCTVSKNVLIPKDV